jgi:hypothetical protein
VVGGIVAGPVDRGALLAQLAPYSTHALDVGVPVWRLPAMRNAANLVDALSRVHLGAPGRWDVRADIGSVIRVVHVITGLDTGGAEMVLFQLLSGMDPGSFRREPAGSPSGREAAVGVRRAVSCRPGSA